MIQADAGEVDETTSDPSISQQFFPPDTFKVFIFLGSIMYFCTRFVFVLAICIVLENNPSADLCVTFY